MFTLQVSRIGFDLTTEDDSVTPENLKSLDAELQAQFLNRTYTFESEEDADENLADLISDECGWCVNFVLYNVV